MELGSNRRETGWSLSVAGVRYQRGVGPSKQQLLLSEVIRTDNSANNGGILKFLNPLITIIAIGPVIMVQFT